MNTATLPSASPEVSTKQVSASDFYGIWGDDGIGAEEAVSELKDIRTFNRNTIRL